MQSQVCEAMTGQVLDCEVEGQSIVYDLGSHTPKAAMSLDKIQHSATALTRVRLLIDSEIEKIAEMYVESQDRMVIMRKEGPGS